MADPLREAVRAVEAGRLVIFPTDTVYGLGARPDDPVATTRVFAAKARPPSLELPVLVANAAQARGVGVLDERAERLAAAWWPGPLTLVVPRATASRGWELGGDPETVGLRVPHHPMALALIAATGPMAVTSANRSGAPPATTCEELAATFGDVVEVYLCQDEPLRGAASTVVDLAHGPMGILRQGAVDLADIERRMAGEGPLLDSPLSP